MGYADHYRKTPRNGTTPQSTPIEGRESEQVKNSAGGYVFPVTPWVRLDRFLILGSEGGSYYASARDLTRENAKAVEECIGEDGPRVVARIVEISEGGRAPKNDPALFALAMAMKLGDELTRKAAASAVPKVARIGTHLLHLAEYVQAFGGWGRGTKRAFAQWYLERPTERLAYQLVKYQGRDGWTQRDVLRQAHPKCKDDPIRNWLLGWAAGKAGEPVDGPGVALVQAHDASRKAENDGDIVELIEEHGLPRESIPTQFLNSVKVWDALLRSGSGMPLTAMTRNLGKMTSLGLLASGSDASRYVVSALGSTDAIKRARVHPFQLLLALSTYSAGCGVKGSLSWTPDQKIVDALDGAFYASFDNAGLVGKRLLIALDVSGSMTAPIFNTHLTCIQASLALAMVMMAKNDCDAVAFTAPVGGGPFWGRAGGRFGGGDPTLTELPLSPRRRLDDNLSAANRLAMGGTDCSIPARWAAENKRAYDGIIIYTDNETWHGEIHPSQALVKYRQTVGIPCKQVVVAMVSNGFTIADPKDAGQMDVVGFDANAPRVIEDFIGGE